VPQRPLLANGLLSNFINSLLSRLQKLRVKSRWFKKDKEHSIEETAAALAFIIWRIGSNGILNLENENFQTDTNKQRLEVITEFLCFVAHITDRLTIEFYTTEERNKFMTELAMKLAKHYEDNMVDSVGTGKYQMDFVKILNDRLSAYSEFNFGDGKPSFPMLRCFGGYVTDVMGERANKWITTQIIDIEAPDSIDSLMKAMKNFYPEIIADLKK